MGSIVEVMAAYYGIELYDAYTPIHDGMAPDGRKVQIKITQGDRIVINDEPDYLLVLHMNRDTSEMTEIYNGPGKYPWELAYLNIKRITQSI